ncbi:unnamed protein product [Tetraodon nigroviridis]|uniref:(spotted green pufferfish) hypothetical protein n=1 Tax=Tetraodon nigroviridis TaxID=99883 RepID=Q4RHU0_TETNG|nr:unnamed protein product [Tetraodon nigroviridis]
MKLFLCIFILLGGVVADPIRAHRGVLMFLNEALATTTGKDVVSTSTVYRNPTKRPVVEPDSEDMSDAPSEETLTGVLRDPDSQEIVYSKVVQATKPASRQRTAADETVRRWVQERGSEETTDPDSEEDDSPPRAPAVHPSRTAELARVPDSRSGELQDLDSLEGHGGRPAPGGNRGDAGHDESRELLIPVRSPAGGTFREQGEAVPSV